MFFNKILSVFKKPSKPVVKKPVQAKIQSSDAANNDVPQPVSEQAVAADAEVTKFVVTANSANIRKGPGGDFEVTRKAQKDDVLMIEKKENNWGKIADEDGWVSLKPTVVKKV